MRFPGLIVFTPSTVELIEKACACLAALLLFARRKVHGRSKEPEQPGGDHRACARPAHCEAHAHVAKQRRGQEQPHAKARERKQMNRAGYRMSQPLIEKPVAWMRVALAGDESGESENPKRKLGSKTS